MAMFGFKEILAKACCDSDFYLHAFQYLAHKEPQTDLAQLWDLKNEAELSFLCDLSLVQDSFRLRCRRRAQLTAQYLIDDAAEIQQERLIEVIGLLEAKGFVPYPAALGDGVITHHMLHVLKSLQSNESLRKLFKRFQRPLCNKWAEHLIRDSLGLHHAAGISDVQIRIAVLSACLTFLRQNVGSCFATAPAILIQTDQIERFLNDLLELLSTGKLKRTFGGVEFSVPLSPSSGIGDLRKGILLSDARGKIWCSPGLVASFEVMGLLDREDSLQKKIAVQEEILTPFLEKGNPLSIEQLVHHLLLNSFELTEDDLVASSKEELSLVRQGSYMKSAVPLKRLEKCQQMLLQERDALAAFRGVCDHPLLKAWEFTLASFSEVKMEFSRWNLYSSLGMHPDEPGGLGEVIYRHLQNKLEENNEKLRQYQAEYELAFDQLRGVEILLKQASTEGEIRRLQAEFQSRLYHMRSCQEMRDQFHQQASQYSTLFSFLNEKYDAKFLEYFQEIYDAKMQDVQTGIYDDAPAGFRLVYKHGRSDASQWTMIYTPQEYIDVLAEFFAATESQISSACEWEEGQKEILQITTAIISHIRTPEFLHTALERMAKAHQTVAFKDPKEALLKAEKKPWAYTSGGTMTTLLKTYFRREAELTEEARWVENESDLLIFLLDVLKMLPPNIAEPYLKNSEKGMLIASPSHAFVLHPGWEIFREGWQEEGFTYTWVRDQIFLPRQKFFASLAFSPGEQRYLLEQFSSQLPPALAHQIHSHFPYSDKSLSIAELRKKVLDSLFGQVHPTQAAQKALFADSFDSFLYQVLPLIPGQSWKALIRRIFLDLFDEKMEKLLDQMPDIPCPIMSALALREAAKGCYLLSHGTSQLSFDLHDYVCRHAQYLGAASPKPCLFADTNWSNYHFGFLVNPGTSRLELWRLDRTGTEGMPMSSWKRWLNGSERKPWSVYTRPYEYGE
jgi:hypothetical protein